MRFVQAGVMLLGSASYLGVLVFLSSGGGSKYTYVIVGGWNTLLVVVAALAIADSVRKARAGRTLDLAGDLLIVKLAAIPYFTINFIVMGLVAALGSGAVVAALGSREPESEGIASGGIALVASIIGLTYLAMLTTSVFGWATISQLRRDGRIGQALAVLYRVMLLLFVLDVVAAIALYLHSRRGEVA